MKGLPEDVLIWELRAKDGRKHVVMWRGICPATGWSYNPSVRINGPVRWYAGRSKSRMKPMCDWLPHW